MTYYFKTGTTFRPTAEANTDIRSTLPVGNYVIKEDMSGMYFEVVDAFNLPPKLYGANPRYTSRILSTFMARENATGVMLAGEKGSGKSLLAKTVSITGAEQNIPTIIINSAWCGDAFNMLIQSIEQPAIILFDEFEKVYSAEQQQDILTLLDGVFPTKKLFLLTCNDKWRVDQHMRNRPGRIFYIIDFTGLDPVFIEEYCKDNLQNQMYIDTICKLASMFSQFNFDMLTALVEEMNRYDESPHTALEMLNMRPEFDTAQPVWNLTLTHEDGTIIPLWYIKQFVGSPLVTQLELPYDNPRYNADDVNGMELAHCELSFAPEDIVVIRPREIKSVKNGLTLLFTKKESSPTAQWTDAF